MKSYQVDLICDGTNCTNGISGDLSDTHISAAYNAESRARNRGWHEPKEDEWLCPTCAAKLTEQGK